MKKTVISTLLFSALAFASCKKDTDNPSGTASIQGKWNVTSILTVEPDTDPYLYEGAAGDYYDFRADGTAYASVDGYTDQTTYEMVDATHVKIDGNVNEIKELSASKLVLLNPPHTGQVETITYTLHK